MQKCSGKPDCKNNTEIDEFMESAKLYIIIIEYRYDQNAYGTESQIKKPSLKWIEIPLKPDKFQMAEIKIQRETLETDDKLYNFGMLSNNITF